MSSLGICLLNPHCQFHITDLELSGGPFISRIESGLQVLRLLAEGVGMSMRRGAAERLVPILMTAPATALGLGLLPLALGSGVPGREIEGPMALSSGAVCRPLRP